METQQFASFRSRIVEDYVRRASFSEFVAIAIGLFCILLFFRQKHPRIPGAKVHGYPCWYEPAILLQTRFVTQAYSMIDSGYAKLKDVPYVLRRHDTDITVLPLKYLEEMRLIPRHKLSESNLHVKVLNSKLNPHLKKYIDLAKSELEYAWHIEIPQPEEWTKVDIQRSMRNLVARMSAKIFMGYPACRDEEWLKISIEFTIDMFVAAFTLRMFPPSSHWLVAHFVPARWRIKRQMKKAKQIVGDLMKQHQESLKQGSKGQDSLLDWMYDNGTAKEREIPEMAARQCVLTMASIHTTSLNVANFLFDLCVHSGWTPLLSEEIDAVIRRYGVIGEDPNISTRAWLQKLEKIDSFFVESQRFNPLILLNPQRMALVPLTLRDGVEIPKGTRIAWTGHHHGNDPAQVPDPEIFDLLRSYRKRHAVNGENKDKYTAGQPNLNYVSFGYGGQPCPGRSEVMLIMAKLLLEFEFKYPEGETRPKVMYADENVFMDPGAKLMMRRRKRAVD